MTFELLIRISWSQSSVSFSAVLTGDRVQTLKVAMELQQPTKRHGETATHAHTSHVFSFPPPAPRSLQSTHVVRLPISDLCHQLQRDCHPWVSTSIHHPAAFSKWLICWRLTWLPCGLRDHTLHFPTTTQSSAGQRLRSFPFHSVGHS